MLLSAGDNLGPYEILGAGGMGEVWKALDTRLDRIVAIKQPIAAVSYSWLKGQHSARLKQEARAIAAFEPSPHLSDYDAGPDYLVLEYAGRRTG
jgi:eukaryotic-like serine/threonine-protein kinase